MEFKLSDKVRFNKSLQINDYGCPRAYADKYLTDGNIYIVKEIASRGFLKLVNDKWHYFYNNLQFEKMYTVKECFEQKIAIWCTTKEEANKVNKFSGSIRNWDPYIRNNEEFEVWIDNFTISDQVNCSWQGGGNKMFFITDHKATQCINFNQLIFEETVEKQVQYYKLKPSCEKYKDAIKALLTENHVKDKYLAESSCVNTLKSAGVLDMWFTPVYEEEFKVGDWITINSEPIANPTLQINKIDEYANQKVYFFKTISSGIYGGSFRKATQSEIDAAQTTKLVLGTSKIEVTIGKEKLYADGKNWDIRKVEGVYKTMTPKKRYFDDYQVEYSTCKIGCSTFSILELKQIIDEYYKFNVQ